MFPPHPQGGVDGFVDLRTAFKIVDRDALLVELRAMSAGDDIAPLAARSALAVCVRMNECARFAHVSMKSSRMI